MLRQLIWLKQGATSIKLVCLVGAPEGVKVVEEAHPDVDIYLASLDDHLNEKGYIVPGLEMPEIVFLVQSK